MEIRDIDYELPASMLAITGRRTLRCAKVKNINHQRELIKKLSAIERERKHMLNKMKIDQRLLLRDHSRVLEIVRERKCQTATKWALARSVTDSRKEKVESTDRRASRVKRGETGLGIGRSASREERSDSGLGIIRSASREEKAETGLGVGRSVSYEERAESGLSTGRSASREQRSESGLGIRSASREERAETGLGIGRGVSCEERAESGLSTGRSASREQRSESGLGIIRSASREERAESGFGTDWSASGEEKEESGLGIDRSASPDEERAESGLGIDRRASGEERAESGLGRRSVSREIRAEYGFRIGRGASLEKRAESGLGMIDCETNHLDSRNGSVRGPGIGRPILLGNSAHRISSSAHGNNPKSKLVTKSTETEPEACAEKTDQTVVYDVEKHSSRDIQRLPMAERYHTTDVLLTKRKDRTILPQTAVSKPSSAKTLRGYESSLPERLKHVNARYVYTAAGRRTQFKQKEDPTLRPGALVKAWC